MPGQVTPLDRPLPPGEGWGEGLPATSDSSISSQSQQTKLLLEIEVHVRCLAGAWGAAEVGLRLEPAHARRDAAGEAAHGHVELLGPLVVSHALDGDAVLGALELRLQRQEVLIGLQFWIALRDDDESRDGAPEALLRGGILRHGVLVIRQLRGGARLARRHDLHLADSRTRLDDSLQGRLLEVGGALYRMHEVGDQVKAALILALNLRPLLVDRLVEADQAIAHSHVPTARHP